MMTDLMQARYLRLTIGNAAGGTIGAVWCGVPLATRHHASSSVRNRQYAVSRGDGFNPAALYAGYGDGYSLEWVECFFNADAIAMLRMTRWMQANDEPIIFMPNWDIPEEATLVTMRQEGLQISDIHNFEPYDEDQRLLSASLELEPVLA